MALGASNFLTGSDEPKSGQTPKPELLVRHGIQAEPGRADVQTPPIDATPTILYAKPVCYEHLHPCASSKLAHERINRKSFTQADELNLSLDPASLCTTPMALEGLPPKVTPPHGMSEVPATTAGSLPPLGTQSRYHDCQTAASQTLASVRLPCVLCWYRDRTRIHLCRTSSWTLEP